MEVTIWLFVRTCTRSGPPPVLESSCNLVIFMCNLSLFGPIFKLLTMQEVFEQAKKRKAMQDKKRQVYVRKQAAQQEVSKKRQREERRDRYRETAQQEKSSGPRQYKKARPSD